MPLNKIHVVRDRNTSTYPNMVKTYCGMEGAKERNSRSEFSTVLGDRFEAYGDAASADCKRCLRAVALHERRATENEGKIL